MFKELVNWLINAAGSAGILALVAYLARDILGKFFSKSVENRFERQLEKFKADIRDNERELDQIRSFLVSARRERDSVIQLKKLAAAEDLLRARQALFQLEGLVEYMKVFNKEAMLDNQDPELTNIIESLIKPFELDESLKIPQKVDKTLCRLYLSEDTLRVYDGYENIIISAAMMMKVFSMPLPNKERYFDTSGLTKKLIELDPSTKVGFDKFGDMYAYHLSKYFHDGILRSLRHEISGMDDFTKDSKSIERLTVESRLAQISARAALEQAGLPESMIKSDLSGADI